MSGAYESFVPGAPAPETLAEVLPLAPFSDVSLAFVEALSTALMRSPTVRPFPELTALAFWMRRSNLERLRTNLITQTATGVMVPRGTVFHIAPANVDTIFVYSWFISLLTGNRNIVRISTKPSIQADVLLSAIAALLADPSHSEIARRTLLIRYAANDAITARFSRVCDVRVVWGGDETVGQIRQIPLPPTAFDVAFSNKYSLALFNVVAWRNAIDAVKAEWISAFYNDTYWFDQMACSSPRLVLWLGTPEEARAVSADFWPRLEMVVAQRHPRFNDVDYVNKRIASDSLAIEANVSMPAVRSNDLVRVWLDEPLLHERHHCGAGLFYESVLPTLQSLRPLLSRKVQTVAYAGFTRSELLSFATEVPLAGIDRFIPIGRALDFSLVWDGFDLPRTFMREISVT